MAPVLWCNLPPDILSILSEILNTDVDLLRLRSVCSSWRTSLPPRQPPIPFPLQVPPLLSHPNSGGLSSQFKYPTLPSGGLNFLNYSTLYRLSPPEHGPRAGDPSHGWLFRVSELNPNTFTFLTPLFPAKFRCPPGTIPENLNLLHHRISEICKCYSIDFVDDSGLVSSLAGIIKKVIVLRGFVAGCDFAVLVMVSTKDMRYWKFGDKDWTPIDTKGREFDDVILFDGKCYAIGWEGELVSFDSDFNSSVVHSSNDGLAFNYNNFVVYKSDLYVVSKIYNREPDEYSSEFEGPYSSPDPGSPGNPLGWYTTDESDDEDEYLSMGDDKCTDEGISTGEDEASDEVSDEEVGRDEIVPLRVKIVKMSDVSSWYLNTVGVNDIFLSSDDVSVGVSSKDFGDCKGNCVYMAHRRFFYDDNGIESGDHHAVFDFDKRRTRSFILERAPGYAKIYWPPPDWLHE